MNVGPNVKTSVVMVYMTPKERRHVERAAEREGKALSVVAGEMIRRADYTEMVREFHEKAKQPISNNPFGHVCLAEARLRKNLIREEAQELFDAIGRNDRVEIADALADLLYVVIGTAIVYGIPIHDVFSEVHRSNMTKDEPAERKPGQKYGGLAKGPRYQPPKLQPILVAAKKRFLDLEGLRVVKNNKKGKQDDKR